MTTASWSTRLRHDDDATYQEWRDELITKLALMSTYLTADETTVVASSGSRPSTNTEESYAVYHLNDSLHATAPVYIRFGFGTGPGTTTPRLQVTVGTATNGSGTLSGTALTSTRTMMSSAASITDTTWLSLLCAHNGYLGLAWKANTSTTPGNGLLLICRTCDSTGAITATGAIVVWGAGAANGLTATQALRFAATAAAYTAQTVLPNTSLCLSPQTPTATAVSGNFQALVCWMISPAIVPIFGFCGVLEAEIGANVTFSVAMVGTSARTYIGINTQMGPAGPGAASTATNPKFAILWE